MVIKISQNKSIALVQTPNNGVRHNFIKQATVSNCIEQINNPYSNRNIQKRNHRIRKNFNQNSDTFTFSKRVKGQSAITHLQKNDLRHLLTSMRKENNGFKSKNNFYPNRKRNFNNASKPNKSCNHGTQNIKKFTSSQPITENVQNNFMSFNSIHFQKSHDNVLLSNSIEQQTACGSIYSKIQYAFDKLSSFHISENSRHFIWNNIDENNLKEKEILNNRFNYNFPNHELNKKM